MSGSLTHPPARIIAGLLVDLAIGTYTRAADWRVFVESIPDSPDEIISVYDTAPSLFGSEMVTGETLEHHGILLRIRSAIYSTGWGIINSIRTEMDDVDNEIIVISGVSYNVQAMNRASGPFHIGTEEGTSKREIFTINYTTSIRQVS